MAEKNTAARVLELARGELGITNGDKYIRYYNELTGIGLPYGVAWCAAWVTWVMRHAGVPLDSVLNYKGCTTASEWFAAQGRFRPNSSGYIPKPGDIIMYEWNPENEGTPYDDGDDHTGIVERVENGKVYTIEGNNGGQCRRDWWGLTNAKISGYCIPLYNMPNTSGKEEHDMTEKEIKNLIATANPTYNKLEDIPDYWQEEAKALIDSKALRGVGDGKLGIKHSELKAAIIAKRYVDSFETA